MEITYLKEFLEVHRQGSFSTAAEELCLSQSALSKHIQALERELDIPLFDRTTRSLQLTRLGEELLPIVQEVTNCYDRLLEEKTKLQQQQKESLTIASIPAMAEYGIGRVIAGFSSLYPNIEVQVREVEPARLTELLLNETADIAFMRDEPEREKEFQYIPYRTDYMTAVVRKDHPLARRRKVTVSDLQGESLLLLEARASIFKLCEEFCVQAGFEPTVVYRGQRSTNVVELAAAGMGVGMLLRELALYSRNPDVAVIPFEGLPDTVICAAYLKKKTISANVKLFAAYMRNRQPQT